MTELSVGNSKHCGDHPVIMHTLSPRTPTSSQNTLDGDTSFSSLPSAPLFSQALIKNPVREAGTQCTNLYLDDKDELVTRIEVLTHSQICLVDHVQELRSQLEELENNNINITIPVLRTVETQTETVPDVVRVSQQSQTDSCERGLNKMLLNHIQSEGDYILYGSIFDKDIDLYLDKVIHLPCNVLVLNGSKTQMIKYSPDAREMCHSLCVDHFDFVFSVVSNSAGDGHEGTHWSLLIYSKLTQSYYHLDSIPGLNVGEATFLASQLNVCCGRDSEAAVVEVPCRRQIRGSVDCGLHVLRNMELASTLLKLNISCFEGCYFQDSFDVTKMREALRTLKLGERLDCQELNIVKSKYGPCSVEPPKSRADSQFIEIINKLKETDKALLHQQNILESINESLVHSRLMRGTTLLDMSSDNGELYQDKNKKVVGTRTAPPHSNGSLPWQVVQRRSKIHSSIRQPDNYPIKLTNKFSVLKNQDCTQLPEHRMSFHHIRNPGRSSKISKNKQRPKILILTDSQGRGLSEHISSVNEVTVYCRPGAKMNHVVGGSIGEVKNLTKNDCVVLLAGSNDVGGRRSYVQSVTEALDALLPMAETTNLLITAIPYRHDVGSRHVNEDIFKANKFVLQRVNACKLPVRYRDINNILKRSDFTKHGLHFNRRGKIKIAKMIMRDLTILYPEKSGVQSVEVTVCERKDSSTATVEGSMSGATARSPPASLSVEEFPPLLHPSQPAAVSDKEMSLPQIPIAASRMSRTTLIPAVEDSSDDSSLPDHSTASPSDDHDIPVDDRTSCDGLLSGPPIPRDEELTPTSSYQLPDMCDADCSYNELTNNKPSVFLDHIQLISKR